MEDINKDSNIPDSGRVITQKTYPVSFLWILKAPIIILIVSFVALLFGYYNFTLVILFFVYLVLNPIIKYNLHYTLNQDSISVKQFTLSKSGKTVLYSDIENVIVQRDAFDTLFGLGSLYINSPVQGPINIGSIFLKKDPNLQKNFISLIGLKNDDAEILRNIILKKAEFSKNNIKKVE